MTDEGKSEPTEAQKKAGNDKPDIYKPVLYEFIVSKRTGNIFYVSEIDNNKHFKYFIRGEDSAGAKNEADMDEIFRPATQEEISSNAWAKKRQAELSRLIPASKEEAPTEVDEVGYERTYDSYRNRSERYIKERLKQLERMSEDSRAEYYDDGVEVSVGVAKRALKDILAEKNGGKFTYKGRRMVISRDDNDGRYYVSGEKNDSIGPVEGYSSRQEAEDDVRRVVDTLDEWKARGGIKWADRRDAEGNVNILGADGVLYAHYTVDADGNPANEMRKIGKMTLRDVERLMKDIERGDATIIDNDDKVLTGEEYTSVADMMADKKAISQFLDECFPGFSLANLRNGQIFAGFPEGVDSVVYDPLSKYPFQVGFKDRNGRSYFLSYDTKHKRFQVSAYDKNGFEARRVVEGQLLDGVDHTKRAMEMFLPAGLADVVRSTDRSDELGSYLFQNYKVPSVTGDLGELGFALVGKDFNDWATKRLRDMQVGDSESSKGYTITPANNRNKKGGGSKPKLHVAEFESEAREGIAKLESELAELGDGYDRNAKGMKGVAKKIRDLSRMMGIEEETITAFIEGRLDKEQTAEMMKRVPRVGEKYTPEDIAKMKKLNQEIVAVYQRAMRRRDDGKTIHDLRREIEERQEKLEEYKRNAQEVEKMTDEELANYITGNSVRAMDDHVDGSDMYYVALNEIKERNPRAGEILEDYNLWSDADIREKLVKAGLDGSKLTPRSAETDDPLPFEISAHKQSTTPEQRAVGGALTGMLRDAGIEVVTDAEEMTRALDGNVDESNILDGLDEKENPSPSSEHQQKQVTKLTGRNSAAKVVINSSNKASIKEKLIVLREKILKGGVSASEFLTWLRNAVVGPTATQSVYASQKIDGETYRLRISDHHANAQNQVKGKYTETKNNTSVVVQLVSTKFRPDGRVKLVEYVYNPVRLTPEKMEGIIAGIENWIQSGEYSDRQHDELLISPRPKKGVGKQMSIIDEAAVVARDMEYSDAVERGDMEKAGEMLKEEAKRKGYSPESDYQGRSAFNGEAPCRSGYYETREEMEEALRNEDFEGDAPLDFILEHPESFPLEEQIHARALSRHQKNNDVYSKSAVESIKALREAREKYDAGDKEVTVTVYRSVPEGVKENGLRNGDWVTLSKTYALDNIDVHSQFAGDERAIGWQGKGRVIEMEVPLKDLWWDQNDVNEWGYDNGGEEVYRNTPNNRKLLRPTYDKEGNLIPLSERFNSGDERVEYLRTASGEIYGFVKDGKVYLDPELMNPNTPVHEYTHLWDAALKESNPELWERGKELMKELPLWEEVKNDPAYRDIADDEDRLASEVHSRLAGAEGEKRLDAMVEEAKKRGPIETAQAMTLKARIKKWLSEALTWVRDAFGHWSKKDLSTLTIEEFAAMPLKDLANGVNPKEMRRKGKQAQRISETNPALDDYHTWVRSASDVRTFDEVLAEAEKNYAEYGEMTYPDMSIEQLREAKESGYITVYSSKPIEDGNFVTPSRMNAEEYAGGGKVYSKPVPVDTIAWIGDDEGQIADVETVPGDGKLQMMFVGERGARNADAVEAAGERMKNLEIARTMEARFKEIEGSDEHRNMIEAARKVRTLEAEEEKDAPVDKEDAKRQYSAIDKVTNKETGVEVEFYNSAFKKVHKSGGLFEKSIPALKKAFEESVFAYSEVDNRGGQVRPDGTVHKTHNNILNFYNYIGKVIVDGRECYVRFIVQEEIKRTGLHSSFVSNVEVYENPTDRRTIPITSRGTTDFLGVTDAKLQNFFVLASSDGKENARSIKLATGWERGTDGKWRYETPDFEINRKGIGFEPLTSPADATVLGDVITEDGGLFTAYPSLRKMPVWYSGKLQEGEMGGYATVRHEGRSLPVIVLNERLYGALYLPQYGEALERKRELNKSIYRAQQDAEIWREQLATGPDREDLDMIFGKEYTEEQWRADTEEKISDLEKRVAEKEVELEQLEEELPKLKQLNEKIGNEAVRGVLLHEVQHAVQSIEGFARGGSLKVLKAEHEALRPTDYQETAHLIAADAKEIRQKDETIYQAIGRLLKDDRFASYRDGITDRESLKEMQRLYDNTSQSEFERLQAEADGAWENWYRVSSPREKYDRLAGEVEARNVQRRAGMDEKERRASLGEETEDVAREKQITSFWGYGESRMLGDEADTFSERQRRAVANRGTVMPGLNDAVVKVVGVPRHGYKGDKPLSQAIDAAINRYVGKTLNYNNHGQRFKYTITPQGLKYASNHVGKSENIGVHAAVMDKLVKVIRDSIEVMEHADTHKKDGKRSEDNGVNPNALIHRFMGVVDIDGDIHRVIVSLRETLGKVNKLHTYEVTKIEVLDAETSRTSNGTATDNKMYVEVTKLLKGAEIHNKSGEKILEESKKADKETGTVGEPHAWDGSDVSDEAKAARANELSERLHTPIRLITTQEEIDALPSIRHRRAKGWYDDQTGEIVVVVPNNVNVADIENTVVHEIVGHDGLEAMIGPERMDEFVDEVYDHAEKSIKDKIDARAEKEQAADIDRMTREKQKAGEDFFFAKAAATAEAGRKKREGYYQREATKEYMADMAGEIGDKGFEKMSREEQTLWGKIYLNSAEFYLKKK